jgi:LytS/YehU family sensor histidine kinase
VAVVVAIPAAVLALYLTITIGDELPFWRSEARLSGFFVLSITGVLVASWMAMSALLRQRDEAARNQALAFRLERSELERKAIDARLRLLLAQVEPHFLFNTLANVRELVDSGSPQASRVLDTLITYLRAAVPRLHDTTTTIGQEVQLVPDRLQFSLDAEEAALGLRCPPTTLLTLVENAVRHGIDPSEQGGRVEVHVRLHDGRCQVEVRDTGVGIREIAPGGSGTGLSTLRERLQLEFGGDADVRLAALQPHGAVATIDFPARAGAP